MHFRQVLSILLLLTAQFCLSQNQGAVLLNQETHLLVDKNKLTRKVSHEILIKNRSGEEFSNIRIYYQRLWQVKNLEAGIFDIFGKTIRKLDKSDIQEVNYSSDIAFYQDVFIKKFTLKHNVYPYIIRYSYEESAKEFLSLEQWIPVLGNDIPTRNATLTLETPADYRVYYSCRNISGPAIEKSSEKTWYTWTTNYSGALDEESYAPPFTTCFPTVEIVPEHFTYAGEGGFSSWKEYGAWESSLLNGLDDLNTTDRERLRQQIEGITEPKEQIRKLYHYVQDLTRYVNISIKTGGMIPQSASFTSEKKYGDCKALSLYFKSILETVGIRSFYTNINAGNQIEPFNPGFPSMQFNHVIVCVPLNSDTLWLDCTSKEAFESVSPFIQDREAFLIDGDKSFFSRTPALKPADVLCSRHIRIQQANETMNAGMIFREIFRGSRYSGFFNLQKYATGTELDHMVRKYYTRIGMEISNYQFTLPGRDTANIRLTGEASSSKIFSNYGNDILVSLVPFDIDLPEKPGLRKLPVQIDYPQFLSDTLIYTLPGNRHISKMPEIRTLMTEFGEYHVHFRLDGNTLTVMKTFLLYSGRYPLIRYPEFYDFISSVLEYEHSPYLVLEL